MEIIRLGVMWGMGVTLGILATLISVAVMLGILGKIGQIFSRYTPSPRGNTGIPPGGIPGGGMPPQPPPQA